MTGTEYMSTVTVSKSSGEDREKFANESALRPASQYGFIRARTNEREFKQTNKQPQQQKRMAVSGFVLFRVFILSQSQKLLGKKHCYEMPTEQR